MGSSNILIGNDKLQYAMKDQKSIILCVGTAITLISVGIIEHTSLYHFNMLQ